MADCTKANFSEAYGRMANFGRANLTMAYLEQTDLFEAVFLMTNLTKANFRQANFEIYKLLPQITAKFTFAGNAFPAELIRKIGQRLHCTNKK
jgi:uncharacterized protein YjbI with pentapeptide repeats